MAATETYPDELRYHPEHDWARIEGDEATLGITWYAGWLVRIRLSDPAEAEALLDAAAYRQLLQDA